MSGFLGRLLDALGEDYPELSLRLGIPAKEIQALEAENRGNISEMNRDILWTLLSEHVDERIGELISIREELSRKLAGDRKRQIVQRARIRERW